MWIDEKEFDIEGSVSLCVLCLPLSHVLDSCEIV